MGYIYESYRRLESYTPFGNLERGFRAEVHDPLWMLGRQWQLGEHQGEDASSPVEVAVRARHIPLAPPGGDSRMDPQVVPPEAIVESEAGDWWTPGRRIRLGKAYAEAAALPDVSQADPALVLQALPFPYDRFNGRGYDGYALYRELAAQGASHAVFVAVPANEPADMWDPAELAYAATMPAGPVEFALERHDGGHIDWYSVDVAGGLPPPGAVDPVRVIPTRMQYPGAPHPRWWQIENARVDIGGFPPDRAHFATMLLIDLAVSHSDDWFTFPIKTGVGKLVQLDEVTVKDSFDDTWTISAPPDWTLFALNGYAQAGLNPASLLVWPTVTAPLEGAVLEDVVLGIDEDANLLWAVEQRVHGRDLQTLSADDRGPAFGSPDDDPMLASDRTRYRFRPSVGTRPYWHPYTIQPVHDKRRFVQGRLADLSGPTPEYMPAPEAVMLYDLPNYADDPAQQTEPVHQIEPSTIPPTGLRLKRRWMLVRQTDGFPRAWIQRERRPLLAPPVSGLRFDVFEEAPQFQPAT